MPKLQSPSWEGGTIARLPGPSSPRLITAIVRNLSPSQKLPHIQNIYALGGQHRRFLGLLLASSCPHAHGGEVSSVIAPGAQAYPQRQRPWVIGSSHLASRGHARPRAPRRPPCTSRSPRPSPAPTPWPYRFSAQEGKPRDSYPPCR